jgi:hypothetical protein
VPVLSIRIERSPSDRSKGRRTRGGWFAAVAVVAVASLAATGLAYATHATPAAPSTYTAIQPVKILTGRVVRANRTVRPVVRGGTTTVPTTATSVLVSVGVSAGTTNGTLDVSPSGTGPAVPSMRWKAGQPETQQLTVRVGVGGKIALKNVSGKVTISVRLLGYYAPPAKATTYVTSPTSAKFLWNSQYLFETSPGSYTEYFTRYDDVSVPALTQSVLDSGSLQVFMTPSPLYNPGTWLPLPYQFDSASGYTYNFTYMASPGHVVLMFYFIQTSTSATLPTLSTYSMDTYNFKIVVSPSSAGASTAAVTRHIPSGHTLCTAIPDGKSCTVR